MPDHAHYSDDDIVNPETRHEESDVNVRALLWAVVIFIVFAGLTHLILFLQFHAYARYFRNEPSQPMTMMPHPINAPPSPVLQPFPHEGPPWLSQNNESPITSTPLTDMAGMRAADDEALNKAGWIDQKKGIVQLPIETAKKLVVQRGLPVVTP